MSLRLHDTATRSVRDFVPLEAGRASLYLCGATVQAAPHVGHIRSGVNFDVLARWLRASGYEVVFCRNVTDIDDKIIAKGELEGRPWWSVASEFEREFTWAYDVLGCTRPTVEPRATGHVTEMVELMEELIEAGHAYAVGGDVYFDVRSFPEYGALSGQRPDEMQAAGEGAIVNIASVAATVGIADRFAYSMTKGAVVSMTLSVAKDYAKHGVRCNAISPARVHTPFVDGFLAKNYPGREAEMFAKLAATQPIGRMGRPEEVADLALFLCSDEASFITGSDYPLDGGFIRLNS